MIKPAEIMAICNQKGGVGKTVTTVSLGIGLAREGKRVLLADIDAQGSLTASLGYQHPDQIEKTLATVMGRIITDEPLIPGEGIIRHEEGIDLLPANIELSGLVRRFYGHTLSGDVQVESSQLPEAMELSSKSGDCEAHLPDAGPFTLRYKTVSGDMRFAFPFQYGGGGAIYGDGSGPAYSMTSVSGDLILERY